MADRKPRDPASEESQDEVAEQAEETAIALTAAVIALVAKALKDAGPDTTMAEVAIGGRVFESKVEELVNRYGKRARDEAARAVMKMAEANDAWAKRYFDAKGMEQVPYHSDKALSAIAKDAVSKVEKAVDDAYSMGSIGIVQGNRVMSPRDAYVGAVQDAVAASKAGEEAFAASVRRTTSSLAQNGLRVSDGALPKVGYPSGRTRELYSAVRMNEMGAYREAMQALRDEQGRQFGADGVEVSAHGLCAPDHAPYQGRQFSNKEFERIQDSLDRKLVTGANCVIEGTKVDASGATVMFRRHYEGEIVRIRTRFGNDLSVTPNHPILTDCGWVAAKDIQKGYNVVSGGIFDGGRNSVRPYDEHCIAAVEDCFGSASHKSEVFGFASSSTDFHGDGIVDQKVDVVFVNSELRNNVKPSVSEHVMHSLFHDASGLSDFRLGCSPLAERFVGLVASPDRIMGSGGDCASFFAGEPRHGVNGGVSPCCGDRMTVFGKNPSYDEFVDSKRFSNASFGHSALVERYDSGDVVFENRLGSADSSLLEARDNDFQGNSNLSGNSRAGSSFFSSLDEVIDVYFDSWAGHVYNLSTDCGYYLANGIITHNCGHMASPILLGISVPAYSGEALKDMRERSSEVIEFRGISGKRMSMSRYDASQYQRSVEAKARKYATQADMQRMAGVDATASDKAYRHVKKEYNRLCREAGLVPRSDRMRSYFAD